ncbi:MAG: hypothetical protein CVT88_09130 [Candidatus Altiarchaeales archaeon HGW-Altiarchaeales-1]|nr:MAG: hypothetical protein CVT88_09130 [Candidatus Altiarchaeales archaeon HGW-Altiarchaeales-1]
MDLSKISTAEKKDIQEVGIDANNKNPAYMQKDASVIHSTGTYNGVEVISIREALQKYDWAKDYYWKAVDVGTDKFTASAELNLMNGYFIRAEKGVKAKFPVSACLFIGTKNFAQSVHNIIIAEEDSELNIISGCLSASNVESGIHIGISEFYIKKGAKISFTMIHKWNKDFAVRPRSVALVEENGKFISNYICMSDVQTLQTYPVVKLNGKNSVARLTSILIAKEGAEMDVGGKIILNAENTKGEIISRAITTGGKIIARGNLTGNVSDVKAHMACQGLILSNKGSIKAIPEIEGNAKDVEMSHEAAVGKIEKEKIEYLMARGLSEEQATSTIVRGFLNVEIEGLHENLKRQIDEVIEQVSKEGY